MPGSLVRSDTALLTEIVLKINGTAIEIGQIVRCEAVLSLNRPSELEFAFHESGDGASGNATMADDAKFAFQAEVVLVIKNNEVESTIFKGEITSVSLEIEAGVTYFTVRAHDKFQRLFHGNKVQAHANMKYSDFMTSIISDLGLTADVESTNEVFPFLYQAGATDGDHVLAIAAELGRVVAVKDGRMSVKKPTFDASPAATISAGGELLRFRVDQSTTTAVGEVEVRGWDPANKAAVVGTATSADLKAEGVPMPTQPSTKFSRAKLVVSAPTASKRDTVTTLAKGLANRIGHAGGSAEGTVIGNPAILPGEVIQINGAPDRFKGTYYVTEARHTYVGGSYETDFRCSSSLAGVVSAAKRAVPAPSRPLTQTNAVTVLPAIVTNVKFSEHPDALGPSVKVKFPTLDDAMESDYLRLVTPGAGPKTSVLFPPSVDDEVLVVFADGDLRTGYVLGGLYNGRDKLAGPFSDSSATNGEILQRGFTTEKGTTILLDDTGGSEKILIENANQHKIEIDKSGKKITIDAEGNTVVIDGTSKAIELTSSGDITLKADMNIKIEAGMALEMKAGTDAKLDGLNVNVNADAQATLKGSAAVEVSSSGMATLKGSMVMIN